MSQVVLGLDIGPNSIGWALVDENGSKIINLGVRVFPEGVDNFDTKKEKSRNEDRRIARGIRRQIARRALRKQRFRKALIDAGLFPADKQEQQNLLDQNPYELRAKALHEKLTPHEFGRILLHLNQRRGFLSNRKKDRDDKEVRGMLEEISSLAAKIAETGAATLGEYLYRKCESFDHAQRVEDDHIRGRHTRRSMLENEFELIWSKQSTYYPELLTNSLKYGAVGKQQYPCKPQIKTDGMADLEAFGIHGLMFFQRKMYWPRSVVGLCELEPKQKRCPRADRHAQKFRLLQEVNNLKYIDPDSGAECVLSDGQRKMLVKYLSTRDKATFDQLRKKLGFLESVKFNLERGKRSSIKGLITDHLMANKAVCGQAWYDRPDDERDTIVRMLLNNEREDDAVIARLIQEHKFTAEEADAALGVEFPPGHVQLSLRAIDKLLPHMERGLIYQSASDPEKSALHAAGYLRRDELQRRLFDELPDPARVNLSDCRIGDIPNPVVKRALTELRKVVNAIIREYGKPDAVHVEMARTVRMGPQARSDYNTRIREIETDREEAATAIREMPEKIRVTHEGIVRYLLWKSQSQECIYCGRTISQRQLFGGDVDVDHILPYSRCLDDSQLNKVVCHRECNHAKGQNTPYEWLAESDPERYARICTHAGTLLRKGQLPYSKYRRFLQKELELDGFIARQLTDTGYINRMTVEYLKCLFDDDKNKRGAVLGLKGQTTSTLRHLWGLNTVLSDMPDSPAWQEEQKLSAGEKNRADHRHHAIDALVVALTNRSRLQSLSRGFQETEFVNARTGEIEARRVFRGEPVAPAWANLRDDTVEFVRNVNVSQRVERKVAGGLHEDTLYGSTNEPGVFVVRKKIESLSPNEVSLIRDDIIRGLIEKRLAENNVDVGRGKKVDVRVWRQVLGDTANPILLPPSKKRLKRDPQAQGIPIKKVRVFRKEQTIQPIRDGEQRGFVKPGATHHLCIFEWTENGQTKRAPEFTTMLEAMQRLKARAPLIRRHPDPEKSPHIPPDADFVMSLSRGETVLANWKGEEKLLVFRTAASTQGQIYFAEHTDARRSSEIKKFVANANTLNAQKVTVDPLGRIRWAND